MQGISANPTIAFKSKSLNTKKRRPAKQGDADVNGMSLGWLTARRALRRRLLR